MLRIKEGYMLRKVLDIYLVIGIGEEAYAPNSIMSVNDTGAYLWDKLKNGSDKEQLLQDMVAEYEVDEETAKKDIELFLTQLEEKALVEVC